MPSPNAILDYVQEKHPEIYKKLQASGSQVAMTMASRLEREHLGIYEEALKHAGPY